MPEEIPEGFIELKGEVIDGMLDYMEPDGDEDFDPGYTKEDVETCAAILQQYLVAMFSAASNGDSERIIVAVKTAVVSLNKLNEKCGHSLIETDQREQICQLIISSAVQAGLEAADYDITAQWREW
jgi:hypothetical protein